MEGSPWKSWHLCHNSHFLQPRAWDKHRTLKCDLAFGIHSESVIWTLGGPVAKHLCIINSCLCPRGLWGVILSSCGLDRCWFDGDENCKKNISCTLLYRSQFFFYCMWVRQCFSHKQSSSCLVVTLPCSWMKEVEAWLTRVCVQMIVTKHLQDFDVHHADCLIWWRLRQFSFVKTSSSESTTFKNPGLNIDFQVGPEMICWLIMIILCFFCSFWVGYGHICVVWHCVWCASFSDIWTFRKIKPTNKTKP